MTTPDSSRRITRNAIGCLLCHDLIESKHRHDFVQCSCGNCHVDGGLHYVKIGAKDMEAVSILTEYES